MSAVVKCDGPGCDRTRNPSDGFSITVGDLGWLEVTARDGAHDFHDTDCLVKWAGGSTTVVDLTELARAWVNPPPSSALVGSRPVNFRLVEDWPELVTAINRLLGT